MMKSSNPALRSDTFTKLGLFDHVRGEETMTVNGTVNKVGILLVLLMITAAYSWTQCMDAIRAGAAFPVPLIMVGAIGGFGVALLTIFVKKIAYITAPIYSALEGILIGAISAMMELKFPGIVTQAMLGTMCVTGMMFFLYKSRIIQVTENFKLGVVAATGAIGLVYLISFIMSFFGAQIPYIHQGGLIGIGFSVVVIGIAALNLVMDFDFIERGEEAKAPKFMEWYGAFALMVTLIWLYMEILRLLSKMNSRK